MELFAFLIEVGSMSHIVDCDLVERFVFLDDFGQTKRSLTELISLNMYYNRRTRHRQYT